MIDGAPCNESRETVSGAAALQTVPSGSVYACACSIIHLHCLVLREYSFPRTYWLQYTRESGKISSPEARDSQNLLPTMFLENFTEEESKVNPLRSERVNLTSAY